MREKFPQRPERLLPRYTPLPRTLACYDTPSPCVLVYTDLLQLFMLNLFPSWADIQCSVHGDQCKDRLQRGQLSNESCQVGHIPPPPPPPPPHTHTHTCTHARTHTHTHAHTHTHTLTHYDPLVFSPHRTIKLYYEQDSLERRERGIQVNNKPKGSSCCGR